MKIQPKEWVVNDVTDKELFPKYVNSSYGSIKKKQPNQNMGRRPK